MSEVYQAEPQVEVVEKRGSRGCLYGCLGAVVVLLLLMVCSGVGFYYFLTGQVEKYTAEAPMEMPEVAYTEQQVAELQQRLETFKEAINNDQPAEDLVLTSEEINALINENEDLRGKAHVDIEDGLVSGDISIPTDMIPGGDGRYFNASGSFDVRLENGVLVVTLTDAEVKGEPVPAEVMEAFRKENLAKDVYKDPDNAKVIRQFESIEVVDDKIIMKLRRDREAEAASEAEAKDETEAESATEADAASEAENETEAEAATEAEPAPEAN